MIVKYADGKMVEGFLLSRQDHSMRVALEGGQDVVEYVEVQGGWVSDNLEPVEITVEWQRHKAEAENLTEDAFVCPQELASHLIRLLATDSEDKRESRPRHFTAGHNIVRRQRATRSRAAAGHSGKRNWKPAITDGPAQRGGS